MIINSLKQGWFWEDIIIESSPTSFVLNSPSLILTGWSPDIEEPGHIGEENLDC